MDMDFFFIIYFYQAQADVLWSYNISWQGKFYRFNKILWGQETVLFDALLKL